MLNIFKPSPRELWASWGWNASINLASEMHILVLISHISRRHTPRAHHDKGSLLRNLSTAADTICSKPVPTRMYVEFCCWCTLKLETQNLRCNLCERLPCSDKSEKFWKQQRETSLLSLENSNVGHISANNNIVNCWTYLGRHHIDIWQSPLTISAKTVRICFLCSGCFFITQINTSKLQNRNTFATYFVI